MASYAAAMAFLAREVYEENVANKFEKTNLRPKFVGLNKSRNHHG